MFIVGALLGSTACQAPAAKPPETEVVWRALGTWSGQGNRQTESFTSDSGSLRALWKTSNPAAPGAGAFRLTIHSAISGRPLQEAVD